MKNTHLMKFRRKIVAAFMRWSAHQTLNHASYFLYTLRLSENVGERLCLPVPTLSKILHKMPDHPTHTTSIKLASPYNKLKHVHLGFRHMKKHVTKQATSSGE
jgi:hypothetical protein